MASNTTVRTNVMALNSHRNLGLNGNLQARTNARLSSGFRINSAADDAAGLGISEKMRAQIRGLDQASRNAADGISLIQTAEGALGTVNDILIRIRELVIQSANDTNVGGDGGTLGQGGYSNIMDSEDTVINSDRMRIQDEIDQLMAEIDQISERAEFNTRRLLDGNLSNNFSAAAIEGALNFGVDSPGVTSWDDMSAAARADLMRFVNANAGRDIAASDVWMLAGRAMAQTVVTVRASVAPVTFNQANLAAIDGLLGANAAAVISALDAITNLSTISAVDLIAAGVDPGMAEDVAAAIRANAHQLARMRDGVAEVTAMQTVHTIAGVWGDNALSAQAAVSFGIHHAFVGTAAFADEDEFVDWFNANFGTAATALPRPNNELWFHTGANSGQGMFVNIESFSTGSLFAAPQNHGFEAGETRIINIMGLHGWEVQQGTGGGSHSERTSYGQGGDGTSPVRVTDTTIEALDSALARTTRQRSLLGAVQNRLEFAIENLDISSENLQASESRIRDADMAREMMRLTQANVLQQAAISMLAQANQAPQSVLQLLG